MSRGSWAIPLLAPVTWALACGGSTSRHHELGAGGHAGTEVASTMGGETSNGFGGGATGSGVDAPQPGAAGAPTLGEVGAGGEGLLGDPTRDILDTALEVNVRTGTARATITFAPSASTAASLEIGDLEIQSVVTGSGTAPWIDRGSVLDFELPNSKPPLTVTIDYTFRSHESSDGASAKGFTLTWPYFCGNVFPCHSSPADGSKFQLQVLGLEPGQVAIYPTRIVSDAPAYMAAWIVGNYTELPLGKTSTGRSLSMWYLPGGEADAKAGGAHLLAAFEALESKLGSYRFGSSVGAVAAPWDGGALGGMEHHPFWHVAVASMKDEGTQVHEAAHGWFGNGVRLRCWEDFVLSEGTVSYLAPRILAEIAGVALSDPIWLGYKDELDGFRKPGKDRVAWPQSCGNVDILKDGLFSRSPYVKGAFFYRGVELKVGRAALDDALRTFYQRYRERAAGMQDMLDVIHEVTGYDPQECAQAWLVSADAVPQPGACP